MTLYIITQRTDVLPARAAITSKVHTPENNNLSNNALLYGVPSVQYWA
jgi:hypothetical protein